MRKLLKRALPVVVLAAGVGLCAWIVKMTRFPQ